MIDISFQGAKLSLKTAGASGNIVLEFSDEGTPVEFSDLEVCGYAMTLNGELVTWTKPTPITMSITVIPGSTADKSMRNVLIAGHVGGKKGNAIDQQYVHITSAVLEVPAITTNGIVPSGGTSSFTLSNGRLYSGSPGMGSNAEGKMSAKTYRFVFESISMK